MGRFDGIVVGSGMGLSRGYVGDLDDNSNSIEIVI